jgi:hypothetical protein
MPKNETPTLDALPIIQKKLPCGLTTVYPLRERHIPVRAFTWFGDKVLDLVDILLTQTVRPHHPGKGSHDATPPRHRPRNPDHDEGTTADDKQVMLLVAHGPTTHSSSRTSSR